MEKLGIGFLARRRRLPRVLANLQKSHTEAAKHFMMVPARAHHQPRLIAIKKLAEAKGGDGPRGKTLARDPGATTASSSRCRGMGQAKDSR